MRTYNGTTSMTVRGKSTDICTLLTYDNTSYDFHKWVTKHGWYTAVQLIDKDKAYISDTVFHVQLKSAQEQRSCNARLPF